MGKRLERIRYAIKFVVHGVPDTVDWQRVHAFIAAGLAQLEAMPCTLEPGASFTLTRLPKKDACACPLCTPAPKRRAPNASAKSRKGARRVPANVISLDAARAKRR